MRRLALLLSLSLLSFACSGDQGDPDVRDGDRLVTVITSPDPQTQLMAMVLTMQAVNQGAAAEVLLCGPGGDLALASPPPGATAPQPPRGMSPQSLIQAAMQAGARVSVCAIYLPGRGEDSEVLLTGIEVAAPDRMAATMMDPAVRVWSF